MTGGGPLPVRKYGAGDVAQMRADAAAVKARLFAPRVMVAQGTDASPVGPCSPRWGEPRVSEVGRTSPAMCRENYLEAMREMAPEEHSRRSILGVVAAVTGISSADITGHSRLRRVAKARHVVMYLCRHLLKASWGDIGRLLFRDHTSVIFGCRKVSYVVRTLHLNLSTDAVVLAELLWSADWPTYGVEGYKSDKAR